MDINYTSKNHLRPCSVFLGELITPGTRENSRPNYTSICLACCGVKSTSSQAEMQELHTGPHPRAVPCDDVLCTGGLFILMWCDFHSLISECGLWGFLVSAEAQILTWSWFNLLDNWHAGLASNWHLTISFSVYTYVGIWSSFCVSNNPQAESPYQESEDADIYHGIPMTRCSPVWIVTQQWKKKPQTCSSISYRRVSEEERAPKVQMPSHIHTTFGLDIVSEPRAGFEFYN